MSKLANSRNDFDSNDRGHLSASGYVFSVSVFAFVAFMLAVVYNASWLIYALNPYPHSVMASGIIVGFLTLIHSAIALVLLTALLFLKAWIYAATVGLFTVLALIPFGILAAYY